MSELKEYYRQILWSKEEDDALVTYYHRYGLDWDGWPEVLPRRTHRMIAIRAARLGLRKAGERGRPRKKLKPTAIETYVINALAKGMTVTEIDEARHWDSGTAKEIVMRLWRVGHGQ